VQVYAKLFDFGKGVICSGISGSMGVVRMFAHSAISTGAPIEPAGAQHSFFENLEDRLARAFDGRCAAYRTMGGSPMLLKSCRT
jgi:hypothetical protein